MYQALASVLASHRNASLDKNACDLPGLGQRSGMTPERDLLQRRVDAVANRHLL
jgi:hypothetical protein